MTYSLAVQLGPRGIRANALYPGIIDAAMSQGAFTDPDTIAELRRHIPSGEIGLPEDVADPGNEKPA